MLSIITHNFKNPKTVLVLYNGFVHSRLEFASTAWNLLNLSRLERIEGVQRDVLFAWFTTDTLVTNIIMIRTG